MKDLYGRNIDYMRVSITDRCNLRCKYCTPYGIKNVNHSDILTYEEILRICKCVSELGIKKIKITGGEPLVRLDSENLIRRIKSLPLIEKVTITTNAVLLQKKLHDFQAIDLDGINISLDTLNAEKYKEITGRDNFKKVWDSIEAALDTDIRIKLNCVSIGGFNDDEFIDFFKLCEKKNIDIRFIEMMPIGYGKQFKSIKGVEIFKLLQNEYSDLYEVKEKRGNGPARYFKSPSMKGCIGFIDAVNHKFCDTCNRIRLTSEGYLKSCLYFNYGIDLRSMIRSGADDESIKEAIKGAIINKPKEHKFYRLEDENKVEVRSMAQIGG
jgi:cyclic pyranopterin phosphate synthase